MPKSRHQKIRLRLLYDVLYRHTDENNPLSTEGIIDLLKDKHGISIQNKAVINDIKLLNEFGYEIKSFKKKSLYFYVDDRPFELSELKILIDAVQAANFIPINKTKQLVTKIADLAGNNRAEILKKSIVFYDINKRSNKYVFYSVDTLITAIEGKKKASFLYYDFDVNKNKVYRKGGNRYVVNPLALIYTNDKYYLACYSDKYHKLTNYRIDRMEKVEIETDHIIPIEEYQNFNVHTYKHQAFSMYGGELRDIMLSVDNSCIDAILDRFGEHTPLMSIDDTTFRVRVKVQVSPTFFAWCLNSCNKIRIIAPKDIVLAMNDYIKSVLPNDMIPSVG